MNDARPLSILMLAPLAPWPVNSGSKVRMFHLTRALSARHRVTMIALGTPAAAHADAQRHLPEADLHSLPDPRPPRRTSGILRSLRRDEPIHVSRAWNAAAAGRICRLDRTFDVVHVFHLTMTQYLPFVRARLAVYDPMGHEGVYMERLALTVPAIWRPFVRWNLRRVRGYEPKAVAAFDCVLSVSEVETPMFRRIARPGATVATVPIAPDTSELLKMAPAEGNSQMVLFGGSLDWFPNIDAARFLAREVWPMVSARLPGARLVIAGKDPGDDVRSLGTVPGVTVVANPSSMLPWLSEASVVTAPIRTGSGIKIKTVEAMAAGKAVVATTLGCEGWDVSDGVHLRRADTAAAFAESVVALLSDAQSRRRLGTAAQQLVRERYTIERMVQRVEELYRTGLASAGAA